MPKFDATSSLHDHKFSDIALKVPFIFTEGHTLSALEALFLNRQVASVVGNAFGGWVRRTTEKMTPKEKANFFSTTDFQAKFDEDFAAYELGANNRSSGGTSVDPLTRFARAIAEPKINELLKSKGIKVNKVREVIEANGKSKHYNLITQFIERNSWVTALAQQQLDAMASTTDNGDLLDGLDDLPEPQASEPAEAAAE